MSSATQYLQHEQINSYYVCGPTVYTNLHVGNYRPYIVADIIKRVYGVHLYIGITDIADKISELLIEGSTFVPYLDEFVNLLTKLKVTEYTLLKVSDGLTEIEKVIDELEERGHVVITDTELRLTVGTNQQYALWKFNKPLNWATKYGSGMPGWHVECVANCRKIGAKTQKLLHGGGIDLKNTHHKYENLIFEYLGYQVQWLHTHSVTFKHQKMAKSKGNVVYPSTLNPLILRYIYLATDYNKQIEFTDLVYSQRHKEYAKLISKIYTQLYICKARPRKIELPFSRLQLIHTGTILRKLATTKFDINLLYSINLIYEFIAPNHFIVCETLTKQLEQHTKSLKARNYELCDNIRRDILTNYSLLYTGHTLIYVLDAP